MSDLKLLNEIVRLLNSNKCKNYMFLKCTSVYPAEYDFLNLNTIRDMKKNLIVK